MLKNSILKIIAINFLLLLSSCNLSFDNEKALTYDEVKTIISSYDFSAQKLIVNSKINSKINSESFTNNELTIKENINLNTIQHIDFSSYSSYYVYSFSEEEHTYDGFINQTLNSKLEILSYISDNKLFTFQKIGEISDVISETIKISEDSFKQVINNSIEVLESENRLNEKNLDVFNNKSKETNYFFNESKNELTINIKEIDLLDLPFSNLKSNLTSSLIIDEITLKYDKDGYITSFEVPLFQYETSIESLNIKTITEYSISQHIEYKNDFNRLEKL